MTNSARSPHTLAALTIAPLNRDNAALAGLGVGQVRITGGAWRARQETNAAATIPHVFEWLERAGTIDNLRRLAQSAGTSADRRGYWFTDADLYKAMESLGWELAREPSPDLAVRLADLVTVLEAAQEDDGYLNSSIQAGEDERWASLGSSHEMFCVGHLIQAAIASVRANGDGRLLEVAIRAADNLIAEFGEGRNLGNDGHEEIEMALVELYRETSRRSYLDLATQLIDLRGHRQITAKVDPMPSDYYQDSVPIREQTEAVGHAVRALYLLCGVVDVYIETGEGALLDAALAQWTSMTASKTYLTGALGSRQFGEAFGPAYEQPQDLVYGETCATIANIMLSWRLLLATGEARFADAIERALYNVGSAAVSVDGTAFFYRNPAHQRVVPEITRFEGYPRPLGPGTRSTWYECACCPPNIARTMSSLGGLAATYTADGIQLQQYFECELSVEFASGTLRAAVHTAYPEVGEVTVDIHETPTEPWTLSLRVPAWAPRHAVAVNGSASEFAVADGYVRISRTWSVGDSVVLSFPVAPRFTVMHPSVDATRGAVAVERGPVVYALESTDHPGLDLDRVELRVDAPLIEVAATIAGQSTLAINASGVAREDDREEAGWRDLDRPPGPARDVRLTLIPYALWANRGSSTMRVFAPARRDHQ